MKTVTLPTLYQSYQLASVPHWLLSQQFDASLRTVRPKHSMSRCFYTVLNYLLICSPTNSLEQNTSEEQKTKAKGSMNVLRCSFILIMNIKISRHFFFLSFLIFFTEHLKTPSRFSHINEVNTSSKCRQRN